MIRTCLLGCLLLSSTVAKAQEFQIWNAVALTGAFSEDTPKLLGWFDLHARRGSDSTVLIVRPALGVAPTSFLSLHLGGAWVPNLSADSTVNEYRVWQQVTGKFKLVEGLSLQSRTRFEQRLRADSKMGLRLREFVRAGVRPVSDSPFGLVVWDELFWQLNDVAFASAGFDQNRLFVGGSFSTSNRSRLEAGYINVVLNRGESVMTHTLAVTFFANLGR